MKHKNKGQHMAQHKGAANHKNDGVEPESWGHGQHANMPKEVAMHDYPKNVYGDSVRFRDDLNRLQNDAHDDQKIKRRNVNRGMY